MCNLIIFVGQSIQNQNQFYKKQVESLTKTTTNFGASVLLDGT